jgi:D-alanyl-D-alanine carboxypeptidase (penicillin-binding protein 5/6)
MKWLALPALCLISVFSFGAFAEEKAEIKQPPTVVTEPGESEAKEAEKPTGLPFETKTSHMILLDAETGTVLAQRHAWDKMYPSSMTKLMTLYLVFDALKQGSVQLKDSFTVSQKAWAIQGSKMFVPIGEQVPLEDLIRGIAIQSGNDACIVVAEGLAGSEEAFAERMNKKAKEIGMTGTNFLNSSGWPDENHYTTAGDLAVLASHIIAEFSEYYHYFSEKEFTYNGIQQFHRNVLLNNTALGVDGLKTGHTEIAGYGIVLSAKQPDGRRLILVLNGLESQQARAQEGEAILNWGFRNFELLTLAKPGTVLASAPVWLGQQAEVALTLQKPLQLMLPNAERNKVTVKAEFNSPVAAPITQGQVLGKLIVTMPSGATREEPLVAASAVEKKGAFARIPDVIGHWLGM